MNWDKIWASILDFLKNEGLHFLYAVLVLAVGYIAIKVLCKILRRIFDKAQMEKITQSFIMSIIKFALYVLLWLTVIGMLGIDVTGVVAFIAAAGVAVGLALQNSLANLANGVVIITTKPFKEGDLVNIGGVEGKVKSIKMLSTKLLTNDNKIIVLPNSDIVTKPVINYSDRKLRRVDLRWSVDYASDLELVRKVLNDVMQSDGRVLLEPMPFVGIDSFGASNIEIVTKCWVYNEDYWDVYYYLMDNVYNEFKRNNINIAYDQIEVRLRDDKVEMPIKKEKLQQRVEIKREEELESDLLFPIKLDSEEIKKRKLKKLEKNKRSYEEKLEKVTKELDKLKPKEQVSQQTVSLEDEIKELDIKCGSD